MATSLQSVGLGLFYFFFVCLSTNAELPDTEALEKEALRGSVKAQYELARAYANGDGTSRNFRLAHRWFTRAANQGHRGAQEALAKMYSHGDGVPVDLEIADYWRQLAASGSRARMEASPSKAAETVSKSQSTMGANSLELSALLELFIPATSVEGRSWRTGVGSPIQWQTKGYEASTDRLFPDQRVGTVVLTVSGRPIYTKLEEEVVPGTWQIKLLGAKYGYGAFTLSQTNMGEPDPHLAEGYLASALKPNAKRIGECRPESSTRVTEYLIQLPGKHPAWLEKYSSCGSGGCTDTLAVFLNKTDFDATRSCNEPKGVTPSGTAFEKYEVTEVQKSGFERKLFDACMNGKLRHEMQQQFVFTNADKAIVDREVTTRCSCLSNNIASRAADATDENKSRLVRRLQGTMTAEERIRTWAGEKEIDRAPMTTVVLLMAFSDCYELRGLIPQE